MALLSAVRRGQRLRGLFTSPMRPSPEGLAIAQLPEFARARELVHDYKLAEAVPLLARAMEVCAAMGAPPMTVVVQEAAAQVHGLLGDSEREMRIREAQVEVATSHLLAAERPMALNGLVLLHLRRGEWERARALSREGAGATSAKAHACFLVHQLAAAALQGDVEGARTESNRCSEAFRHGEDPELDAAWRLLLAFALVESHPNEALDWVLPLAADEGLAEPRIMALQLAARGHEVVGNAAEADTRLGEALKVAREACGPHSLEVADIVHQLARARARRMDALSAEGFFRGAVDHIAASDLGHTEPATRALYVTLMNFADLVGRLSTNGTLRTREAEGLRQQAHRLLLDTEPPEHDEVGCMRLSLVRLHCSQFRWRWTDA